MLRSFQKFAHGESYWKVILTSGREISEVQTVTYNGKNKRPILWLEDVVASGDAARIAELGRPRRKSSGAWMIKRAGAVWPLFGMSSRSSCIVTNPRM